MRVMANSTSGGGSFSPNQARAVGIMVATPFAIAAAPAVVPALRFGAGASTGLVPGMGEVLQGLQAIKLIRLHHATAAGVAAGGVVGLVNMYVQRDKISRFAKDRYDWLFKQIDSAIVPAMDFGSLRSRSGDGPPSLSQRTSKSSRIGTKRRRCTHRNKAGKRCLRPAGHSGRHRYR